MRDPQRERARQNRRAPTAGERYVWSLVRAHRLGVKFRRQHVVAGCCVDFYCVELRLAVEVDGGSHVDGTHRDHARDARLRAEGIRVVRLRTSEISRERLVAIVAEVRALRQD